MKNAKFNKTFFSCIVIFLMCCFSGRASEQDLTIKFMLDSSGAMKKQDIVFSSSSILAAEISDFVKSYSHLCKESSVRILVDSFWQEDTSLQTQGVFDYRIGQSGVPNYDGLRDLKTKWFPRDETALNKLVNRNWPAENKNTVWVVLTNSQETLESGELIAIDKDATKVKSKLFFVILPRKNNYSDAVLKAEIAKRIHGAFEQVKSYILSLQFKMAVEVSVNGKKVDPAKKITAVAPVKISMNAFVAGEKRFSWIHKGNETAEKDFSLEVRNAADFTVAAVGIDNLGNEHRQEIHFNILPVPKAVVKFSSFPVSGVAPLTISITNKSINAQKYQWEWGDGTPSSNEKEPTHIYKIPGKHFITLTVLGINGEVVSGKAEINVSYPAPTAKFKVPSGVSTETAAEFTDLSQNATRWSWNFGDGSQTSTEKNPKHKFAKAGKYTVTLQAFNPDGLSSTAKETISVSEQLVADFDYEKSSSDPRTVIFKNTSRGAVKYRWDFGDGETSSETAPTHSFTTNETKGFNISLTAFAENGQEITKTDRVSIVIPAPAPKPAPKPATSVASTKAPANNPPPSSGSSFGLILVVFLLIAAIGIIAAIKFLKKGKAFTVTLFSKDNKQIGKKVVRVGEIVQTISLNGGSDLEFQIVKADDDSGDDFKVRFRKPEDSPAVLKQKTLKIHLTDQWGDAIDMSNLTVDSGRLVFSEGENEEGEE